MNYRNKLVDFLGDNLDRAEILFSNTAELENKILDNTLSAIKESKEKLANSVNKLSTSDFKTDIDFHNLVNKAQNKYDELNNLELKTSNMFKINTQKGQNGFGEEAISSILGYKTALKKETDEITQIAHTVAKQKAKIEENKIASMPINRVEIPANKMTKQQKIEEAINTSNQINSKQSLDYASKTIVPTSEIVVDWVMPCDGRISNGFGYRIPPVPGASKNHSGIDIAVPIGTPVKTIADGTVIAARSGMRGYDVGVFIDHGIINGKHYISQYGHLSSYNVKVGDKVKQGQVIAKSGNTGISSGPHLHLTIKEDNIPVDPIKYLKKRQ